MPEPIAQTGDRGITFIDVKDGKKTLDEFVAQLNIGELEAITRGDYEMNSPLCAVGNAGAYGARSWRLHSTLSLWKKCIPF